MSSTVELLDSNFTTKNEFREFSFPLKFRFKIGTLSNDFTATDADGKMVAYVRQKLFKLKDSILIYAEESKTNVQFKIDADRIIDFNASYSFTDNADKFLGRVGRKGMRSLWKAKYDIFDELNSHQYSISEENPWSKVFDALLGEVPLLSLMSGYLFNPRYVVTSTAGETIARLSKERSFFGRRFTLEKISDFRQDDGERIMLALMMMVLLERRRG